MKQYLTKEKYSELVKQIEEFKTKGRREVAARLRQAKSLGDLSENADYQEARDQQSTLERRIHELEEVMRHSEVIAKKDGDAKTVEVGSKVRLKRGKDEMEFMIVGSHEAKPSDGLISNESPIGKALLGKKVKEKVVHETPRGKITYVILSID